jgi:glycerol kinase
MNVVSKLLTHVITISIHDIACMVLAIQRATTMWEKQASKPLQINC